MSSALEQPRSHKCNIRQSLRLNEFSLEALCLRAGGQDRSSLVAGRAEGSCRIYSQLPIRRDLMKKLDL